MSLKKGNITISGLGSNGYSPSANVSQSGDTTTITITDKTGTTTANIDLSNKQDIIQYETLPTASASNEGNIVQYIGATDSTYTNGYFYQCVSDGEETPTYSWENIEVQASGGDVIPTYFITGNDADSLTTINTCCTKFDNNEPFILYLKYYRSQNSAYYYSPITIYKYSNTIYKFYGINSVEPGNPTGNIDLITITGTGSWGNITRLTFYYESIKMLLDYGTYAGNVGGLSTSNTKAFTPTGDYNPSTKLYTDKTHYENMSGYEAVG